MEMSGTRRTKGMEEWLRLSFAVLLVLAVVVMHGPALADNEASNGDALNNEAETESDLSDLFDFEDEAEGGEEQLAEGGSEGRSNDVDLGTLEAADGEVPGTPEDTQNAESAPVGDAPEQDDGPRLDEIVVKAQKREQNVQDVPLSITAISDVQIEQSDMEDLNDLGKYTPNLKVQTNGIFNHIYIRGLGSGFNEGFDQSVGFFIDDVYYARSHYLIAGLLDVSRVEVLRGPQGTLFGKNTVAGAVSIFSGTPHDDYEAKGSVTLGRYDLHTYHGVLNVPIVEDRIAGRFAAYYTKRDGFLHNTTLNQDDGAQQVFTGRAKVRFEINDQLSTTVSYLKNRGEIFRGIRSQLSAAVNPEWLTLMRSYDPQSEANVEDGRTSTDAPNAGVQDSDDVIAYFDYEPSDHLFQFIVAASQYTRDGGVDFDATPVPMMNVLVDQEFEQISAELRVVSPPGEIEYVAGLYYLNSTLNDFTDLTGTFTPDIVTALGASILGVNPPQELSDLFTTASVTGTSERRISRFRQNTESASAFGQLTWYVTEDLSLIGGMRYGIDIKDVFFEQEVDPGLVFQGIAGMENFSETTEIEERDFAPKVSALWSFAEWGNVYATYAVGGKSGGFNALSLRASQTRFEPESADTYEAGVKTELFDGKARLNISGFRTDFENLQINVFNGFDNIVRNAPEAVVQGVEVDFTAVTDFNLTLFSSFSYLDSYYAEFSDGPCQSNDSAASFTDTSGGECDLKGEPLTNAPKFQGSVSGNQMFSLDNFPVDLMVGGDVLYQHDVYLAADVDPLDMQPAQWKFNARAGLMSKDQRFALTLFVKNLTDETTRVASGDVALFIGTHVATVDQPRTWTLNLRAEF